MKEKQDIKTFLILFIVLVVFYAVATSWAKWGYEKRMTALRSMNPEKVTLFKIYPRVIMAVGDSSTFNVSDPIISEFFQALWDVSSYSRTHDTIASTDHSWCLIVSTDRSAIQIDFHIPYGKGDIVAGEFDGYGSFQSRRLYQWYQKYSHRWLTPEGAPPAPKP